jgi:hypothetical protein
MPIPFTQYLLPDGRRVPVSIDVEPDIQALAEELMSAGHRFECEMLRTGEVSFTVTAKEKDEPDIAIEVCANGPQVLVAVDNLVKKAHMKMKEADTQSPSVEGKKQ